MALADVLCVSVLGGCPSRVGVQEAAVLLLSAHISVFALGASWLKGRSAGAGASRAGQHGAGDSLVLCLLACR